MLSNRSFRSVAMINYGLSISSLLGLFDVILAIIIFIMTLSLISGNRGMQTSESIGFHTAQLIIVPLFLAIAGIILIFQGWRLDPILQIGVLCLQLVVTFLSVKDFFLYRGR